MRLLHMECLWASGPGCDWRRGEVRRLRRNTLAPCACRHGCVLVRTAGLDERFCVRTPNVCRSPTACLRRPGRCRPALVRAPTFARCH